MLYKKSPDKYSIQLKAINTSFIENPTGDTWVLQQQILGSYITLNISGCEKLWLIFLIPCFVGEVIAMLSV